MSGDFFIRSSLLPSSLSRAGGLDVLNGASLSLTGAGARSAGTLATLASLTGARSAGTLATLASLSGASELASPEGGVLIDL